MVGLRTGTCLEGEVRGFDGLPQFLINNAGNALLAIENWRVWIWSECLQTIYVNVHRSFLIWSQTSLLYTPATIFLELVRRCDGRTQPSIAVQDGWHRSQQNVWWKLRRSWRGCANWSEKARRHLRKVRCFHKTPVPVKLIHIGTRIVGTAPKVKRRMVQKGQRLVPTMNCKRCALGTQSATIDQQKGKSSVRSSSNSF